MSFLLNNQVENLQVKNWEVVPNGAYINLYPQDFADSEIWEQICEQLNVSAYDTKSIEVLYFAKKTNINWDNYLSK
jgi:hypothetical protein